MLDKIIEYIICGLIITVLTVLLTIGGVMAYTHLPLLEGQTYRYELDQEISDETVAPVIKIINNMTDDDTLILSVSSPGGLTLAGMRLEDVVEHHKGKIIIRVGSLAASAAAVPLCVADELQINDSSFILFHISHLENGKTINTIKDPFMQLMYKSEMRYIHNKCGHLLTQEEMDKISTGEDVWILGEDLNKRIADSKKAEAPNEDQPQSN